MGRYNWTYFCKRINIKAEIPQVYEAWAKPALQETWFLRTADYVMPDRCERDKNTCIERGDTYKWHWHGWSDAVVETGLILEANGKNYLKFTFGKAGIVGVRVKEEHGEVICELLQKNIPEDKQSRIIYHIGCIEGWTFYLANLKSILEGGIDLRNKNDQLENMINS